MAKKAKPKKPAKSKQSTTQKGVGLAKQALGIGGKAKGTGRKRKRSALFYAREIQRIKLKRKYDKLKMGV